MSNVMRLVSHRAVSLSCALLSVGGFGRKVRRMATCVAAIRCSALAYAFQRFVARESRAELCRVLSSRGRYVEFGAVGAVPAGFLRGWPTAALLACWQARVQATLVAFCRSAFGVGAAHNQAFKRTAFGSRLTPRWASLQQSR